MPSSHQKSLGLSTKTVSRWARAAHPIERGEEARWIERETKREREREEGGGGGRREVEMEER